ncbi:MAG TPA: ferrochelatase [Micropepsaceae bacterium]|nr:ferrochelatase [Micropepsaceae bacterium]
MKLAVVLFNLGGPDSLDTVEPFLRNLFNDLFSNPGINNLPGLVRRPLARFVAARRAPVARKIFDHLGGRSPILAETEAQALALEKELACRGLQAKCFIAMRCWHPMTVAAAQAVKDWSADEIVLLPLYPQYSTTTTRSSLAEWRRVAKLLRLTQPQHEACCYPFEPGFITALTEGLKEALARRNPAWTYRVLFSAHGLPKKVVERGDPYQWQVERTVEAILTHLDMLGVDSTICYQSRVGRSEWIGPATDAEIRRAGTSGKGVIVVPVAFVSEHSETLVELDIEYGKLARASGVPDYIRVPVVRTHPKFIAGLATLVNAALHAKSPVTCAPGRICPLDRICGHDATIAHA